MKKLFAGALVALSLGAGALPTTAGAEVWVQVAPPPPRHEVVPPPRHGHVWAPGHWEWNGRRHVWVPGSWLRARPGHRYHPSAWVERNGRWYFQPPGWRRDRDGDGVPNRYDRRPNDPYRR